MTNDEVVLLGKKALKIAKGYVKLEDAEDIANDVVEHVLIKQPKDYRIKYLVIDALRKRFGRMSSVNASTIGQLRRAGFGDGSLEKLSDEISNSGQPIETWEDYERVRAILDPIRRCIVTLLVKYGFTNREVADCFNKDESWVSLEMARTGRKAERFKILKRQPYQS